jgi:FKBP-type peptidyl-prolyl cis-trans isomerase FkpA
MIIKNLRLFTGLSLALCLHSTLSFAAEEVDDKIFYFMGTDISKNLEFLELSDQEQKMLVQGFSDALAGKAEKLDSGVYTARLNEIVQERMAVADARELEAGKAYAAEMAALKGAVVADSGLIYIETKAGSGSQPDENSTVVANYRGTLRDGTVFDSSFERGQPIEIGLKQVIPCWTEGIAMMKVGGTARLICPSDIAYGPRGQGDIPPNAVLAFDVELIEVK